MRSNVAILTSPLKIQNHQNLASTHNSMSIATMAAQLVIVKCENIDSGSSPTNQVWEQLLKKNEGVKSGLSPPFGSIIVCLYNVEEKHYIHPRVGYMNYSMTVVLNSL